MSQVVSERGSSHERFMIGLKSMSRMPLITDSLLQRGYSEQDVKQILGENFPRVLESVCGEKSL